MKQLSSNYKGIKIERCKKHGYYPILYYDGMEKNYDLFCSEYKYRKKVNCIRVKNKANSEEALETWNKLNKVKYA